MVLIYSQCEGRGREIVVCGLIGEYVYVCMYSDVGGIWFQCHHISLPLRKADLVSECEATH